MYRQQIKRFFLFTLALASLVACQQAIEEPTPTLIIPTAIVTAVAESTTDTAPVLPPPVTLTPSSTVPSAATPNATATSFPAATETTYGVAFVLADDVLNVRNGAGVGNDIVGTFRPNATGVSITGSGKEVSGSTWVPVTDGRVSGWVNGRFLTEIMPADRFCQDPAAQELLAELKTAVKETDNARLAQLIHPERGLRIRTNWWNPEVLLKGTAHTTLFSSSTSYDWGTHDGSGEPYVGSFSSQILPLLQEDLLNATETGCHEILAGPTAGLVQLPEEYKALNFYSLYRPATDESGFDWGTWVVGIEQWNGRYYLSYLVHFAWEI